ncbi:MAG: pilus assembly protein PilM [Sedimentibacter sp.]
MAKILSIDIDQYNIRIMEVIKRGEILSICQCISIDNPACADDGKITNMDLITDIIKEVLVKNDIKTRKSVFIINTNTVITRKIKLPLLKKKSETLSMIKLELEHLLSADISQYKIIYKVAELHNSDTAKSATYVIYCLPTTIFNQYIELSKRLKFKLISLDISFNCYNKIFQHGLTVNKCAINQNSGIAFAHINRNTLSFCVMNKGVNEFSRISTVELEEKLIETAAENPSQYMDSENSYSDELMIKWLDEINKFIRYYYYIDNDNSIEKLFIYGINFNIDGFKQFLSLKMNCEVEIINNISNIEFDDSYCYKNFDINNYFNSILALLNNKKDIDFLSDNYKYNKSIVESHVAAIVFSIFLMFLFYYALNNYNMMLKSEIESMILVTDDENVVKNNLEIENLKNEVAFLQKYIEQIELLKSVIQNDDYIIPELFREISYAVPPKTKVTSISVDRNNTQLLCVSNSMVEVTLFLRNLREIDFIDSLYIPTVEAGKKDLHNYSYTIVCKLKDVNSSCNE